MTLPLPRVHSPASPLAGKRIVVTRPRARAAEMCDRLAALGATPIIFPTIQISPMEDYTALDAAIRGLTRYHWVIFTSVNGVAAFWNRLDLAGLRDPRGLPGRAAAIGPATARALEARGVQPSFIPEEYVAEAIAPGLGEVAGTRILLPCADIAREALAAQLRQRGAIVDEIAAYRTLPAAPDPAGLAELRRGVDAITFTSASTVRNFAILAPQTGGVFKTSPISPVIACIGPITAAAAREAGLPVHLVAPREAYTADGLLTALADYYSRQQ